MMQRIDVLSHSINRVLTAENNRTEHGSKQISNNELEKIMDLVEGLQGFFVATKSISAEKYVSRSLIIPIIYLLENSLTHNERDSMFLNSLKTDLRNSMNFYFDKYGISKSDEDLMTSTVLDPRSKLLRFIDLKARKKQFL